MSDARLRDIFSEAIATVPRYWHEMRQRDDVTQSCDKNFNVSLPMSAVSHSHATCMRVCMVLGKSRLNSCRVTEWHYPVVPSHLGIPSAFQSQRSPLPCLQSCRCYCRFGDSVVPIAQSAIEVAWNLHKWDLTFTKPAPGTATLVYLWQAESPPRSVSSAFPPLSQEKKSWRIQKMHCPCLETYEIVVHHFRLHVLFLANFVSCPCQIAKSQCRTDPDLLTFSVVFRPWEIK